jgi:putative phage-type endonuclease
MTNLRQILQNYVTDIEKNGILQHTKAWLADKQSLIGGSSIASIMGLNPFSSQYELAKQKVSLIEFDGNIKTQWGNLFEDMIKQYVEFDKECEIIGENIYIRGGPGTCYSPDGLGIIGDKIVLFEFKCPFNRIPTSRIPVYYTPQVKMGLDIIEITHYGLFAQGVFRRCSYNDLDYNNNYDKILVAKSKGKLPLACGVIGFAFNSCSYAELLERKKSNIVKFNIDLMELEAGTITYVKLEKLIFKKEKEYNHLENLYKELVKEYNKHFECVGNEENDFAINDLGDCPLELFKLIMGAYDKKILTVNYSKITNFSKSTNPLLIKNKNTDYGDFMDEFSNLCSKNNDIIYGILPWKLFYINYIEIEKEKDYVKPWIESIKNFNDIVVRADNEIDVSKKMNIISELLDEVSPFEYGGFSDELN